MAKTKIDYTTLLNGERPDNDLEAQQQRRWWLLPEKDMPDSIDSCLTSLYKNQARRQAQLVTSSRLYGNLSLIGMPGIAFSRVAATQAAVRDRVTYNVCQSTVDTITSKIAKNKPKPYFLTSGGDWKIQRRAEKLGKFVDGCFYENEIHRMMVDIFRDACVWGTGVIHIYSEDGQIKSERVLISELYVDEMEGFYGKPRQLHRVKNVDREVLADAYPDHKDQIMQAVSAKFDLTSGGSSVDNIADQVTISESWHLRSGAKAKDGKHVLAISNTVLMTEDYEEDNFPFAFFHWNKRLYGFYGQGLVEQIQNIQAEINKLLWVIQRSMHLAGSFKILLENGSKIVSEHLNNELGALIKYTGKEPSYVTPPIVPQEIYAHLMTLKNAAFEQAGISQLSAAAKKPDGLNSGKALREYNDIESDRFMVVGQAYENLSLDISALMITEAKKIYKEDKGFKVNVPGKKFLETIRWRDVDMKDDQYIMKVYPVSSLPDEPAGRLQTVQEMLQAGMITPDVGRKLLQFPDLEAEDSLENAETDLLHKILDDIVEEGIYQAPEPTDNLAQAEKFTLEYIAKGRVNALEDEKLDQLRMFLDQVHILQAKASQAQQPQGQPPAGGPGPQGVPAPAPTSDLLPNGSAPMPMAA